MESVPFRSGPAPWACQNMSLRSRREKPIEDTTNARGYERWRGSVPQPIEGLVGRPDVNDTPPFFDRKPTQTRVDAVHRWTQSQPFVVDPAVPVQKNPYFTEYDIASDPRNVGRELRGVVSEPSPNRGVAVNNGVLERAVQSRYMPESEAAVPMEKMLESYNKLRPALNDMTAKFR